MLPAGHVIGTGELAGQYVPTSHGAGVLLPLAQKFPPGHGRDPADNAIQYLPAGQITRSAGDPEQ